MKTEPNPHIGSTLESLLVETGDLEEVEKLAAERVAAADEELIATLQKELQEARAALFTEPVEGPAWEYPIVRRLREERDHYRWKLERAQEDADRFKEMLEVQGKLLAELAQIPSVEAVSKLEMEVAVLRTELDLEKKLKGEALYQAEIEAERADHERERSNEALAKLHDARRLLGRAIADTWADGLYREIRTYLEKS